MQPKFTQRKVGFFFARIVALAMILVASCQLSLAQDVPAEKKAEMDRQAALAKSDNDAGLPNKPINIQNPNNPQAVCTTWTVNLTAANPTTSLRAFRDGVPKTCAAPGTCTAGLSGSFNYQQFSWTNPTAAVQCVTVNFTGTSTNFSFVTAHNGSVNLANLCTNWLGDPGSSATNGQTITWSFNAPPSATIIFMVTTISGASSCTISVDAPLCTPPAPCAGTPNPGNTIASTAFACPTVPVNLTLQNPTPGSGVTYQWQSATASAGPWNNIVGATNASYNAIQTAPTWYRAIVTCATTSTSGTSNPVFVDQNPFYNCYCINAAGSNADEDIFNVTFGTLNNSSNCLTPNPAPGPGSIRNRYSNYRTIVPTGTTAVTGNMPISIQIGTCGGNFPNGAVAWIDFNHNGTFDHPAERIYYEPSTTTGPHTATGLATIPSSTQFGITGMRVIAVENIGGPVPGAQTPCGAYTWGETEDYLVNIQPCVPLPVSGVTAPATVNGECSGIVAIPVNTGSASFPSFQWEYRVDASSPWQMAVDGGLGGVITGATTGTLVLINTPSTLNGYQFRAIATNPCSAPDFTAPPTTLVMGPLVARVNPTSATICNGTLQQLNLASPQSQFCSGTINMNVPDNTPNGINHTINVSGIPGAATITRIDVTLNMTHTWDGDMVIVLKAPNGQILNLDWYLSGTGGAGATTGFVNTTFSSAGTAFIATGSNPYTGTWRADAVISGTPQTGPNGFLPTTNSWGALGSIANGGWTLAMYDGGPADLGVLQNWCITISYGAPITGTWTQSPVPAPPASPYAGMWLNSAGTVPYTGGPASTIWVNPSSNTVYSVIASTTSPACTSAPTPIPVNVTHPLANVVAPVNKSVCTGGTTSFSVTATSPAGAPYNGPFTYQWQESRDNGLTWQNVTNGGVYSGATTNTLTLTGVTRSAPSDMNLYRYRAIVNAVACGTSQTTASAILTVFALPSVSITATDLALTPGQYSTITATSTPNPLTPTSWSWTLNGSAIAGANSNSVVADINKLGVYRATVTDANGCVNSSNSLLIESEVSDRLWIYPNPTTGKFQVRWYYSNAYTEIRRVRIYNANGQQIMSRDFPMTSTTPHYLQMDFDLSGLSGGVYVVQVSDLLDKKHVQGLLIKQ